MSQDLESECSPGPAAGADWFRGYRLIPVYCATSLEQRLEAIQFWFKHMAISESCLAERRSHELVFMARSADGELAGLSNVSLGRRTTDGRNIYDLRLFIAPAHRIPFLMRELVNRTRDLLRASSHGTKAAGLRLIAENPKLCRPGIRRYLERHGFVYRGCNRHGFDQWFVSFDPVAA